MSIGNENSSGEEYVISLLYLGLIDGDLCCKEVAALGDKKFARNQILLT